MEKKINAPKIGVDYRVDYRNIKYPRLEFKTGNLLLILPRGEKEETILGKHDKWIYEKNMVIQSALEKSKNKKLELNRTDEDFSIIVKSFVEQFTNEYNFEINQIIFKKMNSKWGSCTPKRNLMINTLLKYLPTDLIEYVLFHELNHLSERKHNEKFWRRINKKFKNHSELEKDLFIYWFLIQKTVDSEIKARLPTKNGNRNK